MIPKVFPLHADVTAIVNIVSGTTMNRAEAKVIVETAHQVFEILAEERGIEIESPEGDALYEQIVVRTVQRKAKTAADLALMLEVA